MFEPRFRSGATSGGQPKEERLKLVREDGQPGFWWVEAIAVEKVEAI